MKPNWMMLGTTYVTRQAYLKFTMRVRQWGHLPGKRGATVLITYETGFIATVWPRSVRLTRGLNLSWLWDCLSILPIENHLFSRPLISLAEELRAAHGDLALDAILPAEALAPLELDGCVLSDLWKLANFTPAHAWVKVAQLKQPYRREVLENLRMVTKRDIAAIVERVRSGATFYITPEGDFSRDGRMHPMRKGIIDALSPFADLWLCAVAYDPFQGRRLSMLYRVVPYAGVADIGTSLAAARPITTSALLAEFLLDGPETFAVADAVRAVRERLDSLPGNVFVDPELRRAPDAAVLNAFAALQKRGTLTREGERYLVTTHRTDARFPHVPDMITFQRNMLDETLASARRLT
jgi:hypothetical protein